jgi:hypothetical protein
MKIKFIFLILLTLYSYSQDESISILRASTQKSISSPFSFEVSGNIGIFVPINFTFSQTYGSATTSYGLSTSFFYNTYGMMLEIAHYEFSRLFPINEENKWLNATSIIYFTPFYISFVKSFDISQKDWKIYAGIGIGATFIKEKFKGSFWAKDDEKYSWRYTEITQNDTLLSFQILIKLIKTDRFALNLKYSYTPRKNDESPYADFGGVTASFSFFL